MHNTHYADTVFGDAGERESSSSSHTHTTRIRTYSSLLCPQPHTTDTLRMCAFAYAAIPRTPPKQQPSITKKQNAAHETLRALLAPPFREGVESAHTSPAKPPRSHLFACLLLMWCVWCVVALTPGHQQLAEAVAEWLHHLTGVLLDGERVEAGHDQALRGREDAHEAEHRPPAVVHLVQNNKKDGA